MTQLFRQQDLEAYLDEALPADDMARIEEALRQHAALRDELVSIHSRRDSGLHSLGEIWRRHRLTCPTRQQLGSLVLQALSESETDYLRFHLEGCRYCQANLHDLEAQQREAVVNATTRRRRYFQSSAGLLKARR